MSMTTISEKGTGFGILAASIILAAHLTDSAYAAAPPPPEGSYRAGTAGGTSNRNEHVYVDIQTGKVTSNRQSEPFADHVMQPELDAELESVNSTITNFTNSTSLNSGKLDSLNNRVESLESAVAISSALSGIPQSYLPETTIVGIGIGNYSGNNAVAVGVSTNKGSFSYKLSIGGSSRESMVSAGVGYSF